jgi:hypothetical protein
VLAEPQNEETHRASEGRGEAGESTKTTPTSSATEDSPGGQPSKKKLTRKKKSDPSDGPLPPNQKAMLELLALGGYTTDDLLKVAKVNEWIDVTDIWPLTERKLAEFLTEDNRETLTAELDALPK